MKYLAPLALVLAAACTAPAPVPSADGCGAAAFAGAMATPVADVTLPTDRPVRVIAPDDVVTTDYDDSRINFEVDSFGLITRITCG